MIDLRLIGETHGGLQSPLSDEKLRELGCRMGLGTGRRVLDIGAGTGAAAVLFAEEFGCRVLAVESCAEFVKAGTDRARTAGVAELVEYVTCDAAEFTLHPESYDAAVCIGAAWILGGFAKTAEALGAAVRPGGHVAIGDLFVPTSAGADERPATPTLREMLHTLVELGLMPVSMSQASCDDWDNYHSRMMVASEDWVHANPDHPDAEAVRRTGLEGIDGALEQRELSWALVAGRKRPPG